MLITLDGKSLKMCGFDAERISRIEARTNAPNICALDSVNTAVVSGLSNRFLHRGIIDLNVTQWDAQQQYGRIRC